MHPTPAAPSHPHPRVRRRPVRALAVLAVVALSLALPVSGMATGATGAAAGAAAAEGGPAAAGGGAAQIFVNELHYDNEGTDAGEAVELAGPAGADLAGWSLVAYNGSGGAPYNTQTLSGTLGDQQAGWGTHVVDYPANGLQNGSPDGLALVDPAGAVVQFLSYEGTFTAVGGPADGLTSVDIGVAEGSSTPAGHSLALTGQGSSYDEFTWAGPATATFGAPNTGQTFTDAPGPGPAPAPGPCDVPATHQIGQVQGPGPASPLDGQTVTVEGVVVGDFQAAGQLGGVFLQDPAGGDGEPATSDGLFAYAPNAPDVAVGDLVRATGTVDEYHGLTELTGTSLADCGDAAVPDPTPLALPADDAVRERVEGMLVTLPEPVTATDTYTLARYGELAVAAGGRLYQPTNGGSNDDAAEQQANDARRLVIDDGSTVQNPPVIPFADLDGGGSAAGGAGGGAVIRVGDTLTGVVGVLSYGFDAWRLQPTATPTVLRTNPRPDAPARVDRPGPPAAAALGDVRVASFNVLNYFTTLDTPGAVTDTGDDPRGADSAAEFERQHAKIVAAIAALDADVVGLMEIENDADDTAVDTLVAGLNAQTSDRRDWYVAVEEPDTGGGLFGGDAIKVAVIYRPAVVTPLGAARTATDGAGTGTDPAGVATDAAAAGTDPAFANARLPLAQRFIPTRGGAPFTVIVNHFKSKGCTGATGANADQGDGQGCFTADRVVQAQALTRLAASLPGRDTLLIGDLNSYGEEDPIDVLAESGYRDLIDERLPEAQQYSYVFDGQSGYLDHAQASPSLARRVAGVHIWHINADEPVFLDYNTEYNPAGFYAADPYRSSDHDPVVVDLRRVPRV